MQTSEARQISITEDPAQVTRETPKCEISSAGKLALDSFRYTIEQTRKHRFGIWLSTASRAGKIGESPGPCLPCPQGSSIHATALGKISFSCSPEWISKRNFHRRYGVILDTLCSSKPIQEWAAKGHGGRKRANYRIRQLNRDIQRLSFTLQVAGQQSTSRSRSGKTASGRLLPEM